MSVGNRTKPPAVVREAIADFRPVGNFTLLPPEPAETSVIHDWGVRVKHRDGRVVWVCLASESCRGSMENVILLSSDRTSKAVAHLRLVHKVVSEKTASEQQNKRKRDDIITCLEDSDLMATNPERFTRLIETQKIINLNQAFSSGEADESMVINALTKKPEMSATVNAKQVHHSMIELYASTKKEVADLIKSSRLKRFGSLTLMCDFWSCPVTHTKSLGLRVYCVDEAFELKTVLLGVREFNPPFSDRQHYQTCFQTWVKSILEDFNLGFDDFYCGSSDGGSDCQALLKTNLKYEWEWCLAHMSHAATKAACGMAGGSSVTLNPGMEALLKRVSKTISTLKAVESKGSLFKTLCQMKTHGKSTQLANYTPARFLSITTALQRVLEKWDALEIWYDTRSETTRNRGQPMTFPLKNDKEDLIQIVSLLEPTRQLKTMCQATAPNQVSVLLALYFLRMNTLRDDSALEHYESTESQPKWIQNGDLTPLSLMTRKLLQQAFDDRFFARYVVAKKTEECSFIFEMQQKLHPTFKCPERSLFPIVRLCCRQKGMDLRSAHAHSKSINERITAKLRALMIANAGDAGAEPDAVPPPVFVPPDRLTTAFGRRTANTQAPEARITSALATRVEDELRKWEEDTRDLQLVEQRDGSTAPESVLRFWGRMNSMEDYKILPRVVRVLFAVPTSSANIERDFSVCGAIRTPQRASIASDSLDMASFLNRNREYVNVTQCQSIPEGDEEQHTPPRVTYPVQMHPADFFDDLEQLEALGDVFSSTVHFDD